MGLEIVKLSVITPEVRQDRFGEIQRGNTWKVITRDVGLEPARRQVAAKLLEYGGQLEQIL